MLHHCLPRHSDGPCAPPLSAQPHHFWNHCQAEPLTYQQLMRIHFSFPQSHILLVLCLVSGAGVLWGDGSQLFSNDVNLRELWNFPDDWRSDTYYGLWLVVEWVGSFLCILALVSSHLARLKLQNLFIFSRWSTLHSCHSTLHLAGKLEAMMRCQHLPLTHCSLAMSLAEPALIFMAGVFSPCRRTRRCSPLREPHPYTFYKTVLDSHPYLHLYYYYLRLLDEILRSQAAIINRALRHRAIFSRETKFAVFLRVCAQ